MHSTPQRPIPWYNHVIVIITIILLHFTGPSVPVTGRVHTTPITPLPYHHHCSLLSGRMGSLRGDVRRWPVRDGLPLFAIAARWPPPGGTERPPPPTARGLPVPDTWHAALPPPPR
eukprot:956762-Pyramimonas_sp.AAC.1